MTEPESCCLEEGAQAVAGDAASDKAQLNHRRINATFAAISRRLRHGPCVAPVQHFA